MKQYVPMAFTLLLIFGVTACTPVSPATQETAPTQQADSGDPYHPLTTRIGVENVDQILDASANGDTEQLRALVEFTHAQCTHRDGLGGPPKCREGELEGTPMEVLPFLSSEGSFLRREEIGNWTGIDVVGVYAVYEVSEDAPSEEFFPLGKYVILFMGEEDQTAVALRLGESGIVRVDTIYNATPESLGAMIEREASAVTLPPKS